MALFAMLVAILTAALAVSWLQSAIPLVKLYRDTFALAEIPRYLGFFSNLGTFLFCTAGAIAWFTALVLAADGRDRAFAALMLAFGTVTFMLMADDFFLVHEFVEERFRISEKWVFVAYAVVVGAMLLRFRRLVLETHYGYLVLSFSFFALSLLFDKLLDGMEDRVYLWRAGEKYLLEDGSKLLGIGCWLFYVGVSSYDRIRHRITAQQPPTDARR